MLDAPACAFARSARDKHNGDTPMRSRITRRHARHWRTAARVPSDLIAIEADADRPLKNACSGLHRGVGRHHLAGDPAERRPAPA
jgi:hypothetical protein